MKTALSTVERKEYRDNLREFEGGMQDAGKGLHRSGEAAKRMRDGEQWREDAASWADFCRDKLSKTPQWVNRLIQFADSGLESILSNVSQAEALFGLETEQAQVVVSLVEAQEKPVSRANLRSARAMLEECKTPAEQIHMLKTIRTERREASAGAQRRNAAAGIVGLLTDAIGRAVKAKDRLGQTPDVADEVQVELAKAITHLDRAAEILRREAA